MTDTETIDLTPRHYVMRISAQLADQAGTDWHERPVEYKFNEPHGSEIDMSFRYPLVQILKAEDWVALYRNGRRVAEGHSIPLDVALEAMGLIVDQRWVEPEGWDEEFAESYYTGDEFPEEL